MRSRSSAAATSDNELADERGPLPARRRGEESARRWVSIEEVVVEAAGALVRACSTSAAVSPDRLELLGRHRSDPPSSSSRQTRAARSRTRSFAPVPRRLPLSDVAFSLATGEEDQRVPEVRIEEPSRKTPCGTWRSAEYWSEIDAAFATLRRLGGRRRVSGGPGLSGRRVRGRQWFFARGWACGRRALHADRCRSPSDPRSAASPSPICAATRARSRSSTAPGTRPVSARVGLWFVSVLRHGRTVCTTGAFRLVRALCRRVGCVSVKLVWCRGRCSRWCRLRGGAASSLRVPSAAVCLSIGLDTEGGAWSARSSRTRAGVVRQLDGPRSTLLGLHCAWLGAVIEGS